MTYAKGTPTTPPAGRIEDFAAQLRTRLGRYKRTQINRIAELGGVTPSMIYAFRGGGRGSRVFISTVTAIESGLNKFEAEVAAKPSP